MELAAKKNYRPHTFSKLYMHFIFVVKGRDPVIPKKHKAAVQQSIASVIEKEGHELIEINCMPDHTHVLLVFRPAKNLIQLGEHIQQVSKTFIQAQPWMRYAFDWQTGFGVFSCSPSHAKVVEKYIQNQEEHHRKRSFREEYMDILRESEEDFEEKFLFDFYKEGGL